MNQDTAHRAIAIVGLGAVMPDAPNLATFWQNIKNGRYSISEVPPDRWDARLYYDPDPRAPEKTYSKIGGWVREWPWDPVAWKLPIPPRVSDALDRAQKWAIAGVREALADYGYPGRPLDRDRTAVVLGNAMAGDQHYMTALRVFFPEYAEELEHAPSFGALPPEVRRAVMDEMHAGVRRRFPDITEDSMPGELANVIAGRIAALFDFHGPNFVCDAACASGMAAINAAIEGLIEHDYDAVISGGVDANMSASSFVKFCKIGALSATGTRPYADGADGFVMAEGAGLFVLKRLADAERDGDRIYAVLRGMGGSSDGKGKGISAPNPVGQKLAIERAWQNAGLSLATATMVEGHGTSTRVGDVVEVHSLMDVLRHFDVPAGSIALGSVKSNIGHLKGAAGAAGLLKVVMALHEKVLPPSLGFTRPNPQLDFARSPLYVNTELRPWEATRDGIRRAGLSAFGFGGTNFHGVLEEYIPGRITAESQRKVAIRRPDGSASAHAWASAPGAVAAAVGAASQARAPLRGALVIGGGSEAEVAERLAAVHEQAARGEAPPSEPPSERDLQASVRLAIDYADAAELAVKADRARKALAAGNAGMWKALRPQGIFLGRGPAAKVAFLCTGQGSQYVNMLDELRRVEPIVAEVFEEADRVMTPLLGGRPLSDFLFARADEAGASERAEQELRQTEITQPAVLTVDIAITRLLASYGIVPDMVMGHSLGEYAALVAAGALSFDDALHAVSARGKEMARVSVADNGAMAAVFGPLHQIEDILRQEEERSGGYVVVANINSSSQAVIGGATEAVQRAIEAFTQAGIRAVPLPVSHAFHTRIVAPASEPLMQMLRRLDLRPPAIPLVANVSGSFYPMGAGAEAEMVEILGRQIASPVQFVKGLGTLYDAGARVLVEVGPKKALAGMAEEVLGDRPGVLAIHTNHPKVGDMAAFNQALCALYASGLGAGKETRMKTEIEVRAPAPSAASSVAPAPSAAPSVAPAVSLAPRMMSAPGGDRFQELGRLFAEVLERGMALYSGQPVAGRVSEIPVVVTGVGLGLPGSERVFDPTNVERILHGNQLIDAVPMHVRREIVDKHVTRLVKSATGTPRFDVIDSPTEVIKLAGRAGELDLGEEFGVPADRLPALDITTKLAIAAGLEALRDAGIPLVMRYRDTTRGTKLPERWMLPEPLRDDTGVIFGSAFPGYDNMADEIGRYYEDRIRRERIAELESLRGRARDHTRDPALLQELELRIESLRAELARNPYVLDRRFLFRVLSMGHSQFAELIGARGPNTQINAACASGTQAVALAQDWIRAGRCRRVVIVTADDVTTDRLLEWIGAGFLASGAAATDELVEEAAVPFDRRRHGMIMGMGATGMVVESAAAARERGIRPITEVLGTVTANSAFHGSRLDVGHICQVMEKLVSEVEARHGLSRAQVAPELVFMSHETYTPARGGSAQAEVYALRQVFGPVADQIVIANTKGYTGHAMGAGVEDAVVTKVLETGVVPPLPNFKEVDPELGLLNLSRGGAYPVRYALRLGAGFGSQISMSLTRWVPSPDGKHQPAHALGYQYRIEEPAAWQRWLDQVSGQDGAKVEVVKNTLRIVDHGAPARAPELPGAMMLPAPQGQRVIAVQSAPAPAVRSEPAPQPVVMPQTELTDVLPGKQDTPQAAGAAEDPVRARVMEIVARQTGYPPDMLDPGLDLEADLGIDTVKQAEMFAAVREAYAIERDENLQLRDFPTLTHVVGWVYKKRPELARAAAAAAAVPSVVPVAASSAVTAAMSAAASSAVTAAVPSAMSSATPSTSGVDPVQAKVLEIVAQQTGYPPEMLDLELDLEADLGIDTVKQAETFAAVREAYGIERDENLQLREFPTLERVIGWVYRKRPELAPASAPSAPATPAAAPSAAPSAPSAAPAAESGADPVQARVLEIVAQQTGYPPEMLDLELDLEADLGIDTVKQAETFAAVRESYGIARDENLQLKEFPTLKHVIGWVYGKRPELRGGGAAAPGAATSSPPAARAPALAPMMRGDIEAASRVPRRVPKAVLRPPLDLCKPTGIRLEAGVRVILMPDGDGRVAKALAEALASRQVETLMLDESLGAEALEERLHAWLAQGSIAGLYWLPAVDREPALADMDAASWREHLRVRVKLLYRAARALYDHLDENAFVVAATCLGGKHGYDAAGAVAPMGGAVAGFVKTLARERPAALIKAMDFAPEIDALTAAEALVAETLHDRGVVEVGHDARASRWSVALAEAPAEDGLPGLTLDRESIFVITGAAGSIVSAITADLARVGGTFYLLDLAPEPDRQDPDLARFGSDRDGLKRDLAARLKERGEKVTPVMVEKRLAGIERTYAAASAIEAIEQAGGAAHYRSVDLTDGAAVARVIDEIRARHGRVDVLVHAAGLEISHMLPDKKPAEFDLVFDVKVDGWFHLLRAMGDMPLGATVAFCSIAGRFGNAGQTDYAAANDLLCKYASSFRSARPGTRGIAIDWTAWGGIGMAARGSIPRMMEMAHIDILPPEAGIPVVLRELTAGGFRGEVVIAGALGVLMEERDEAGGLDLAAVNARAGALRGPMITRVTGMGLYSGLTIETELDPATQPFLRDHRIEGTPVLPGVMGVEAFAEAARLLFPDWQVYAVEDIDFLAPFKFYRDEPRTAIVQVQFFGDDGAVIADGRLLGARQLAGRPEPQVTTHFRARVRLVRQETVEEVVVVPPPGPNGHRVDRDAIYRIYFHGPAYQVLERAWRAGEQVAGVTPEALPANHQPAEATTMMAPRLIELCFQTAGVWEIGTTGKMGLPMHVDRVRKLRDPAGAQGPFLAVVTQRGDGDGFDARVADRSGNVYLVLEGYRTVTLGEVDHERQKPLADAMR
jgi:malonyl CoA-acyl carrier protein transacylase